jgi:hypothetical protein
MSQQWNNETTYLSVPIGVRGYTLPLIDTTSGGRTHA